MSNKDKHTPLSAEELFKLLEDKSEGSLSEEAGLDDFEQDALDGFSAHLPVEDARRLTEELNAKISEAVQEKGTQKKKIIWFSSAASIALLIVVSVLFFYQTKDAGTQPIALNVADKSELKPFSPDAAAAAMEEAPVVVSKSADEDHVILPKTEPSKASEVSLAKEKAKMATDQQIVLREEEQLEQDITAMLEKQDKKDVAGNGIATPNRSVATEENSKYKKEEANFDIASNQMQAEGKLQESVVSSTPVGLKKSSRKAEATADDAKQAQPVYYDMEMKSGNVSDQVAPYYTGGQNAVKNYITAYLKEKKYPAPLPTATYSIHVTVLTTGKVTVKTLTVNKKAAKSTVPGITEALGSMKDWIPLQVNKVPTTSDLSFGLTF